MIMRHFPHWKTRGEGRESPAGSDCCCDEFSAISLQETLQQRLSIVSLLVMERHALWLCFLLFSLPLASLAAHSSSKHPIHLVFIGDSVMRYSYLDFVYRIHFHQDPPMKLTCNDNRCAGRQKWEDFLVQSTRLFNGAMLCDCFRVDAQNVAENMTETRYYHHPSGKLSATFYLKNGNYSVYGKKNLSEAHIYSSVEEAHRDAWVAGDHEELARDHIKYLKPRPTVVLINQRFWVIPFDRADVRPELPGMMRSLLHHTDHVLWLQGTRTSTESRKDIVEKLNPTDDYVRSELCNSSHPLARSISVTKSCHFIPFPPPLQREITQRANQYYSDYLHFSNNTVYKIRIQAALHRIGLSHLYQSLL
jgi:hypothetical protein